MFHMHCIPRRMDCFSYVSGDDALFRDARRLSYVACPGIVCGLMICGRSEKATVV